MIFTVLGDLDRRPVVFTLMRLISTYGETSVVTNDTRLMPLSDTKVSGGYYLDTQINYAENVDEYDIYLESLYYKNFLYDGLIPIFSDILFYCTKQALTKQDIAKLHKYKTTHVVPIELYSDKNTFFGDDLKAKLQAFEKDCDYTVISDPLCKYIADNISQSMHVRPQYIYTTLTGHVPEPKGIKGVIKKIIKR